MSTWEDNHYPAELETFENLANALYDWHCGMCNAFSGAEFPEDYPRSVVRRNYMLKGKHMSFVEFERYCRSRSITVENL